MLRYSPKQPAVLDYVIESEIAELNGLKGAFTVSGEWPGECTAESYTLGTNWFTDPADPTLFEGKW